MLAGRRRALAKRRFWLWLLHFIKVVFLTIVIILLLVAVGIPVSDNGVPQPGDYSKMQFNWQTDPRSYLSPMNSSFTDYNILLDAHLHTTYSDGVLSPKQVVEYAMANGFNAIIVTDHQTVSGSIAAREYAEENYSDKITVITGMEYTCCRIHMNFIGINESVPVSPPSPSDDELRSVIDKVHSMGGLVIVNHIPWSNATLMPWDEPRLPDNPSREQLLDWGVDGFEVVNQNTFDLRSYQFVQQHSDKLIALTGSDMHYPGSSYAWTTINATNHTAEAIMDEIRNRRTSFLLDASGTRPVQDPPYKNAYFKYAPWGLVGDYFYGYADRYRGQYSFQGTFCQNQIVDVHHRMIGWFFLWLLISIAILEILYWFFRWLILLLVHWVRSRFFKSTPN
ncbi:Polymerase/histidinol phosphatase-like protein [Coemansia spiralis]|nr:Polymerase/histidinol phosphatase-like protein [Coemansia spiralis]